LANTTSAGNTTNRNVVVRLNQVIENGTSASSFTDDTFRIKDNLDITKKIAFQASGITTGTVRTITMPDSDITLAGGDALVANPLSQFAATTSAQLAGVLSDETGTGLAVFATSPTLVTPLLGTPTSGNLANCTGYVEQTGYVGQNLQTGTTYTLVLTDAGKIVEMNNGASNVLTIPANAAVAFPVDTRIDIVQGGAGLTSVTITSDTLNGELVSFGQYKALSLWKKSATVWNIFGGTT